MICGEKQNHKKRAYFDTELKQMAEGKNLDEKSKEHWKHKPYKCDFGGAKDETLRQ